MTKRVVPKPRGDSLVAQLGSLYGALKSTVPGEPLEFDLSELDWVYPLLVLPLSSYISTTHSSVLSGSALESYLSTISFPQGVDSVSSFQQQLQRHKNYIPVSVLKGRDPAAREKLESLFQEMVYKMLDTPKLSGVQNAVYYPITEFVTNIFEHSHQDKGFLFGQYYPTKEYLDICITDCGRGLRTAYKEEQNIELSDEDSMVAAMQGRSTKASLDRGYGLRTSKRLVHEGMGGAFVLISGSAALVAEGKTDRLVTLDNFYWQGVIFAYRIPKPREPIDVTRFLE